MVEHKEGIIVGILGQWASGKTLAAKTLVDYLGGEDEVAFLTDRVLFANQVANHILELDSSKVTVSMEEDGRQRIDSDLVSVWLRPGEDLRTMDVSTLDFNIYDDQVLYTWRHRAKLALGEQIRTRRSERKPIVIELAFGPNSEPENPFGHTISDVFNRLSRGDVEPSLVSWIIIEACYDVRSERNAQRIDRIPIDYFEKHGADGGDLDPDIQSRCEEQGTCIKRVSNNHCDIDRFKAEVISVFEELF